MSARRKHVSALLQQVRAIPVAGLSKDDRIDLGLFRAQLAAADFFGRKLDPESIDPQLYVNECTNALFSLLQKDYAPKKERALAAAARELGPEFATSAALAQYALVGGLLLSLGGLL